jgi:hypothetical protein
MKLIALLSVAFVCVAPSTAQYFSEGWNPGQAVATPAAESAPFDPSALPSQSEGSPAKGSGSMFVDLLTTGPLGSLLDRAGMNITERFKAAAEQVKIWDERIPLITDDNYEDIIVNEEMTEEEERNRVWVLVMCGSIRASWC